MCTKIAPRSLALAATLTALVAAAVPALAQQTKFAALAPAPNADTVSIGNFTFNPPTLKVKAGEKVTWTNKDDIPHGIASSSNAFARSQALDTNESYAFTFTKPGTYQYFCYLHPHMVGTIVVEGAVGGTATQ